MLARRIRTPMLRSSTLVRPSPAALSATRNFIVHSRSPPCQLLHQGDTPSHVPASGMQTGSNGAHHVHTMRQRCLYLPWAPCACSAKQQGYNGSARPQQEPWTTNRTHVIGVHMSLGICGYSKGICGCNRGQECRQSRRNMAVQESRTTNRRSMGVCGYSKGICDCNRGQECWQNKQNMAVQESRTTNRRSMGIYGYPKGMHGCNRGQECIQGQGGTRQLQHHSIYGYSKGICGCDRGQECRQSQGASEAEGRAKQAAAPDCGRNLEERPYQGRPRAPKVPQASGDCQGRRSQVCLPSFEQEA